MLDANITLADATATAAFGARLAPLLARGDVVCLSGPLGAGKTTLARAIIKALSGEAEAPSPTFALVETYDASGMSVWHFDLYRLTRPEEVWELGLEDAFCEGASLIEWPERIAALIPATALVIKLDGAGAGRRAAIRGDESWARRLAESGLLPRRESLDKDSSTKTGHDKND